MAWTRKPMVSDNMAKDKTQAAQNASDEITNSIENPENSTLTGGSEDGSSDTTTETTSSAEGSYSGYSPLLSGEQKFQQLIAEITNGVDILFLCKRNTITVTDFESLYAEAKTLRDNKTYVNEDINLWQLEDGTYELNVNEYGFYNTVNVVYSGGTVTETYEDLVRVYGVMAKTYYDKKLTKTQAQAKAKAYLAGHIRDFGMSIKCSILHNPSLDIGDIVTLENPLTLRDAAKKINKGPPEYLFVKGMSISWDDGGPIRTDLELSYSPESPERDADTSALTNTTSGSNSPDTTLSSDQTGSYVNPSADEIVDESSTEDAGLKAWRQNVWNQLYEITKSYIDVTNRTQYTNRLFNAKTNRSEIAGIVQGHKFKGGANKDWVITQILNIKSGKTTKVTLFTSKSAGVVRKQQQPAHMKYLQGSYNAHKVSAPNSRSAGTAYVKRKNK